MGAKTPDREVLPAKVAERLLARASELDTGASHVAELKQAAMEAGISEAAFEAALAEYRDEKTAAKATEVVDQRKQVRRFGMVIAALVSLVFAFGMMVVPSRVQRVDPFQTEISLSCTSADAATQIARSVLDPSTSSISARPGSLTISAPTQAQLDRVRELITQRERSVGCSVPGTSATQTPGTKTP
jgi:hypothetical protein